MIPFSFVKTKSHTRFHLSSSISKSRMTPIFFVKTSESYAVCRLGHHLGKPCTGTDRNGPKYHIGLFDRNGSKRANLPQFTRLCGPCTGTIANNCSYLYHSYAMRTYPFELDCCIFLFKCILRRKSHSKCTNRRPISGPACNI